MRSSGSLEETGFEITINRLLGVFSSLKYESVNYPWKGREYLHFFFIGEIIGGVESPTDEQKKIGYLSGHMPWRLCEKLTDLGVKIVNKKSDNSNCIDRKLITGASPLAPNELGKLAANTLLQN